MLIGNRAIVFVVLVLSATLGPMYGQRFGRFFIRSESGGGSLKRRFVIFGNLSTVVDL